MSRKFPKHSQLDKLFYTEEDLRWATPEMVADYRAERLKCKVIADLGCGIGFQTFSFATPCQKVYAVDINEKRLELARKNAAVLGLKNIIFVLGDALDKKIVKQLSDAEIIFCDPERLSEEVERNISTLSPNIKKLLELYSSLTDKIALEFPPQIKHLNFACEKEYLSLDGQLNRLTLYFGGLKKVESSAVVLPARKILQSGEGNLIKAKKLGKFLLEVDPAIVKAGLLAELCIKTKTSLFFEEKNVFFTSNKKIKSPFFKNVFCVLGEGLFNEKKIIQLLNKLSAGKVTLRLEVNPAEYWSLRKKYEQRLSGLKTVSLFKFDERAVIGEKV